MSIQFVCSPFEALTLDMEEQISTARAWVNIVPTGEAKPQGHIGAFVTDSYTQIKASI